MTILLGINYWYLLFMLPIFLFSAYDTIGRTGGVGIILRKSFASRFQHINQRVLIPGRVMCVELSGVQGHLHIWCIHLDPSLDTLGQENVLRNVQRGNAEPPRVCHYLGRRS